MSDTVIVILLLVVALLIALLVLLRRQRLRSTQVVVDLLNELYEIDPRTVDALLSVKVVVSSGTEDFWFIHPDMDMGTTNNHEFFVSMFFLLSAILKRLGMRGVKRKLSSTNILLGYEQI